MKIQLAIVLFASAILTCVSAEESDLPLVKVPITRKKVIEGGPRSPQQLRKRDQFNGNLYYGDGSIYMVNVAIGTPAQNFELIIDTGSADLWVPGSNCPSSMCPLAKFNQANSTTFKQMNKSFNITYGIGSASGEFATDVINIGGAVIEQQQFGVVNSTQNILTDMQTLSGTTYTPTISSADNSTTYSADHRMDGIFGLGYPLITSTVESYNPFFFNLKAQNKISQNVFSIYLNKSESADTLGEIIFGGTDSSKYHGEITYIPLSKTTRQLAGKTDYGYWQVNGQGVGALVDGKSALDASFTSVSPFIFDTGTTLTYLPESLITKLFSAAIGTSNLAYDSTNNYFQIRCSMAQKNIMLQFMMSPSASVSASPVVLNIPIADVIYPMDSDYMESATVCMIGIAPTSGSIFLGESILKSLYQVYDVDQNRIGLAGAAGSEAFISSGNSSTSQGSSNSNGSNAGNTSTGSSAGSSAIHLSPSSLFVLVVVVLFSLL